MLLHSRPPHSIRLHHQRDLVPPHKRPSTPLRDHRLPPLRPYLGNGTRILDRMPDEKQRRRAWLMSRDFQEWKRLPLHARPNFGPRTSCGLSGGGVDRTVRISIPAHISPISRWRNTDIQDVATQSTLRSAFSSTTASTHARNNANGSVRRNALPGLSGGPRTKRRLLPRRRKSLRRRRRLCWSRGLRLRRRPGGRRSLGSRWNWMGWHVTWVERDLDDSWISWLGHRYGVLDLSVRRRRCPR
jgi:hypothetical protein